MKGKKLLRVAHTSAWYSNFSSDGSDESVAAAVDSYRLKMRRLFLSLDCFAKSEALCFTGVRTEYNLLGNWER